MLRRLRAGGEDTDVIYGLDHVDNGADVGIVDGSDGGADEGCGGGEGLGEEGRGWGGGGGDKHNVAGVGGGEGWGEAGAAVDGHAEAGWVFCCRVRVGCKAGTGDGGP